MKGREQLLESELFGQDIEKIKPVIVPDGSDSATIDNVFELLVLAGRPLIDAMMMLIGIMIIVYILMVIIPKIDPKNNYKTFIRPYMAIFNTLFAVLFVINLMTILTGLGYDLPISYLGNFIVGVIFMVFGNFIQKVKPNYFLGIRTP